MSTDQFLHDKSLSGRHRVLFEQRVLHIWQTRGLAAWALWPISCVYAGLVALRQNLYRRNWLRTLSLPVPVVVVGNVVVGGTGKTPVTIALIQALQQAGYHPGVISRGFGRTHTACTEVTLNASAKAVGDEPLLIHRSTHAPVVVAKQRVAAAQHLLALHPRVDVMVCDDGLQHLALARDIELVVFDERGVGNGWLLPAGMLREAWPRKFNAQHTLILQSNSGGERAPDIHKFISSQRKFLLQRALADYAVNADQQEVMLQTLQDQPFVALAGIAQPHQFFKMLTQKGLQPHLTLALPDHTHFETEQLNHLKALALNHVLVCTEKDAVKLWEHIPQALAIPLVISEESAFCAEVIRLLPSCRDFPKAR